jgi:hypothetical protein
MLRNVIVALAIVLALGSSAFARGGGYSDVGGDGVFRSSHFGGGFGGTPGDGHRGSNHASGLRGGFPGYGSRDMWGHWGAYYGPMICTI